jgi:hypothetical protein
VQICEGAYFFVGIAFSCRSISVELDQARVYNFAQLIERSSDRHSNAAPRRVPNRSLFMSDLSPRAGAITAVLMSVCICQVGAQAPQADRAAAPSAVRINADGTVSVKADGMTVQALLEALEPACPIQVRLDAKAAARAVSIEVSDVAPAAAVGEVLKASGLDFAMHTRCGTLAQPALVVVRVAGDGPMVSLAPHGDPDDPSVKRALMELSPLPAGPPPEPEKRDDPDKPGAATIVGLPDERRQLAPGEVTGAQMVELLAVRPAQKAAAAAAPVIELPFTDENGQPYLQLRPPKAGTMILPFPDANGNVVEVPIPTGPRSKRADFPVVNPPAPDASGGQGTGSTPAATNPAGARRPGGGGSNQSN